MKRLFLMSLFIGIALLYFGCSENSPIISELSQSDQVTNAPAKKPAPNLTGEVYTDFFPNGNPFPPYFWNGTITVDEVPYGMRFLSLTPPRGYSGAFPFEERFEIWDVGFTTLFLEGPNHGVVSFANSRFRANGKVEIANGPFVMWLGRNVHISGSIEWVIPGQLPLSASGTFRIN